MRHRVVLALTLGGVMLALTTGLLAASAGVGPETAGRWAFSQPRVVIAYSEVSPLTAPLWVAQQQGLFQKYGVEVTLVHVDPDQAMASLAEGKVQLLDGGMPTSEALLDEPNVEYVAVTSQRYAASLYAGSAVTRVEDLAGHRVVTTVGEPTASNGLHSLLDKAALPSDSVKLVAAAIPDAAGMMAAGQAEAWLVGGGADRLAARKLGLSMLKDLRTMDVFTVQHGVQIRREWALNNEGTLKRVLMGYIDGIKTSMGSPELTQQIMTLYGVKGDAAQLADAYAVAAQAWAVVPNVPGRALENIIPFAAGEDLPGLEFTARRTRYRQFFGLYDSTYMTDLGRTFVPRIYPELAPWCCP